MPAKYHQWTWETIQAVKAADLAYTRAFLRAMERFDRAPTPKGAKDAYNAVMGPAGATWQADIRTAISWSDDPF